MINFDAADKIKGFQSFCQLYKYVAVISIAVSFTIYALTLNDGHIASRIAGVIFLFSLWNVHKIGLEITSAQRHIDIFENKDLDESSKESSKLMLEVFCKLTIWNVWFP